MSMAPPMHSCPSCGQPLSPTAKFCGKCGHRLTGPPAAASPGFPPAAAPATSAPPYPVAAPAPEIPPSGTMVPAVAPAPGAFAATPPAISPSGAPGAGAFGAPAIAPRGPIGQVRGLGKLFLLAFITFGIYGLYVLYKSYDEMHRYSGVTARGGAGMWLAFFAGPVNLFFLPSQIATLYESEGQHAPVSVLTGFWIYLPILGPIVWFVKVYGSLNAFWRARGGA